MNTARPRVQGFSLVEVVLAVGVIAFAVVAIVGVFPVALQTSHGAQNETRAPQIAQDIFAALTTQARTSTVVTGQPVTLSSPAALNLNAIVNQLSTAATQQSGAPAAFSYQIDLRNPHTYVFAADNDGNLATGSGNEFSYQVTVTTAPDPSGFATGTASEVTVRVAWQPFAQNYREFVRIVSTF